jgi:hypothetical protein
MSWITRVLVPQPSADAEATLAADSLVDEFLESYVCWREACEDLRTAYEGWADSESAQHDVTFDAYRAALDREEHAAGIHARWAQRLRAVEC